MEKKISGFLDKAGIPKEFMLNYGDLTVGKKLGEGGYGVVNAGSLKKGRETIPVAIKMFKVPCKTLTDKQFAEVATEFGYLQKKSTKSHPSLVRIHGVTVNDDHIYVVSELCTGGDLDKQLYNNSSSLNWETKMKIAMDIAKGVEYLHTKPSVVHRDVKPANIVLDGKGNAKICDFGLALVMTISQTHFINAPVAGTWSYLPPESFKPSPKITAKADVWAVGCILNELFGGRARWRRLHCATTGARWQNVRTGWRRRRNSWARRPGRQKARGCG
eukprot:GHVU01005328.1.p1 GENE.GHVU01005328.1~~GHVU01005328.1.p1  ORF type:complete len:274 (+),score=31.63 GHVU01005328.1:899-1720(+)